MNLQYVNCPYCGRPFTEDSDTVVCPVCGTPAHRSCYKAMGHCMNESRHAEGFTWEIPHSAERIEAEAAAAAAEKKAAESAGQTQQAGGASYNGQPFNPYTTTGKYGIYREFVTNADGTYGTRFHVIEDNDAIGDYTAAEYGAAIRKNAHKFIPKFMQFEKDDRIITWNWAAFFFPHLWLVYRKMYVLAAIATILCMIVPLSFADKVVDYYTETYSVMEIVQMGEENDNLTFPDTPIALTVNEYITFFVNISLAIFGNYLYKMHCDKLIAKAKALDGDGAAKLLKKKGGTSVAAIIIFVLTGFAVEYAVYGLAMTKNIDLATVIWRLFN